MDKVRTDAGGPMTKPYDQMNRVELMMELKRLLAAGVEHEARDAEQELIHVQTEQLVEAQRLLEESRDRYFELYDSAPIAYITMDGRGHILELNSTARRLLGVTETIVGRSLRWLVEPPDRRAFSDHLRRCREAAAGNGQETKTELALVNPAGLRLRVQLISAPPAPCTQESAVPPCFRTALMDLTELRASQDALRTSEERLRLALEGVGVGTWELDAATLGMSWTGGAGLSEPKNGRMHIDEALKWVHPDDRPRIIEELQAALAGRKDILRYECRAIPADPSNPRTVPTPRPHERWVLCLGRVIRGPRGRITSVLGIHVDITDRLIAQQELARHRDHLEELILERTAELERTHQRLRLSERMAALGTLSAGLGHDMGNLLMPVRVRLESLESRPLDPEASDDLHAIRQCVDYLQRLVSGLRMFALDPTLPGASDAETPLDTWWSDAEPFFRNAIPKAVALHHSFDPGLPPVAITRQALTQAVFNLIQNAGDAMKIRGHGQITVWARRESDSSARVVLGVRDNGPGMTPEVRQRCLEPFFTTKPRGISTGMGLALVHGIVQRAGGAVQIDSDLGRGTTFTLTLPARTRAAAIPGSLTRPHGPATDIAIKDPRARSLLTAMLRSMEFDLVSPGTERPTPADPQILVTDDRQRAAQAGPRGPMVLLLGDAPLPRRAGRTIELPRSPHPAHLRQALEDLRRELSVEAPHAR